MNEEQELPQGWIWVSLGQLAKRITDGTHQPPRFVEEGIPFVFVKHIVGGEVTFENTRFISQQEYEQLNSRCPVEVGDVLYSAVGSYGVAVPVTTDRPFSFQRHIAHIKPLSAELMRFLVHVLNSSIGLDQAHQVARGVAQKSVTLGDLTKFRIPLPPLPEQRRIVAKLEELFSKLDAGVAAVRRTQALLKRYRQSVLHAAVTGELTRAWREAHPPAPAETGATLLQRIRAERRAQWEAAQVAKRGGQLPLGEGWKAKYAEPEAVDTAGLPELPQGWTWASMRQLGEVRLGRQRAPQHHSGPHMRPYLRVANVYEDRFDLRDVMEMNFTPEEYEVYALRENDILLNEGQSLELVGRPALYRNEVPGACFTNTLVRFRAYQNVLPVYALSVFRSYLHNGEFQKIASWTTSIAHLGADRFAGLHFPLPPLVEQAEIVAEVERRLTVLDALGQTLADELRRAERLRQSILHRAFTGRLVPQDATDEPAAALLARLRDTPAAPTKAKAGRGRKAPAQQATLGL